MQTTQRNLRCRSEKARSPRQWTRIGASSVDASLLLQLLCERRAVSWALSPAPAAWVMARRSFALQRGRSTRRNSKSRCAHGVCCCMRILILQGARVHTRACEFECTQTHVLGLQMSWRLTFLEIRCHACTLALAILNRIGQTKRLGRGGGWIYFQASNIDDLIPISRWGPGARW